MVGISISGMGGFFPLPFIFSPPLPKSPMNPAEARAGLAVMFSRKDRDFLSITPPGLGLQTCRVMGKHYRWKPSWIGGISTWSPWYIDNSSRLHIGLVVLPPCNGGLVTHNTSKTFHGGRNLGIGMHSNTAPTKLIHLLLSTEIRTLCSIYVYQ